jgi:hypothetical protein
MIEVLIGLAGLGLGDYLDPANLNIEDDKQNVIVQETCTSTTTINNDGNETKVLECQTMKTINTNEEKD